MKCLLRGIGMPLALALCGALAPFEQGQASSAEPPLGALIDEISFADSPPQKIYLDLAPDGATSPFQLQFDTGAAGCHLTSEAARELGVSVRTGRRRPYATKTRLGGVLQCFVHKRPHRFNPDTSFEYALFGGHQLMPYVFEIDFSARVVRFYDGKKYRLPLELDVPGESLLPLRMSTNRPLVEVEMDGKKTWMLVDTGMSFPIVMSGRHASEHGIDVDALPDLLRFKTVRLPVDTRLYEAPLVKLGASSFADVPVLVAPRGLSSLAGQTGAVLGFDILQQFVVRFDYQSKRMWLKRVAERPVTFLGVDYSQTRGSGVFLSNAGTGYWVMAVLPGSAADRLGIRTGDFLRTASGRRPSLAKLVRTILEGRELTVARSDDGRVVDVRLGPVPTAERGG